MMRKTASKGFTLLELLMGISIFSVVSLLAYELMDGARRLETAGLEITQHLEACQKTMQLLHRDITNIVPTDPFHAGTGVLNSDTEGWLMVSGGLPNPDMALKRSHLVKVGYRVRKNNLERLTWPWRGRGYQATTLFRSQRLIFY